MPGIILTRLAKGADLVAEIGRVAREQGLRKANIQLIGALSAARLGYYIQSEQRYIEHAVDEAVEILAGLGNVSIKDDDVLVHLHLTLGRRDGSVTGGHAMDGCVIFAAECSLVPVEGKDLVRRHDAATGLYLWS
ncbi:MAG: PPC domain-containing DNA-binding protein [Desulfovibrionaceae bacterium]